MSNGDDVLDNWEEIDEVGLDSKLNKLKEERRTQQKEEEFLSSENKFSIATNSKEFQQNQKQQITSPLDDMSSFQNTVPLMMVLHKSEDEYQSANYMQPTKSQTVKILRRPIQSNEARGNGIRPKQPIKTLQQREQEYAEARLRILGSAKNPEDDAEASSTSTTKLQHMETSNNIFNNNAVNSTITAAAAATTTTTTTAGLLQSSNSLSSFSLTGSAGSIYNKMPASQINISSSSSISGGDGGIWNSVENNLGAIESTGFSGGQIMIPQSTQNIRQQQENILRMPKGPDGSLGFQMRR